jgi:GH15 family glucan-1,4-alpha-glucosidase
MALAIEDYAYIGDLHTGALVGKDGSIDWLCLPRFDSGACFAALLGTPDNGRWLIAPAGRYGVDYTSTRSYREDSLVLETVFETPTGSVKLIDCMPIRDETPDVVRRVEGVRGAVEMTLELAVRFDYGSHVPWLRREGNRVQLVAGPDTAVIDSDVRLETDDDDDIVRAGFRIREGEAADFRFAWTGTRGHFPAIRRINHAINATDAWWKSWVKQCTHHGEDRDAVVRSLITLKALTYAPSGGIVAAATTSLPEQLGGVRNWDYRYCWVRDATLTLLVLIRCGYFEAAAKWREWLVRAVGGRPEQLQIMYGIDGERRLTEMELGWLSGYQGAKPVRIGNGAHDQLQLDVFGEMMDAMHVARVGGMALDDFAWKVQTDLMDFLESNWREPDEGIWEVRGPRRHFTHSKVMAWVAMDRAVKTVEQFGNAGPVDDWRRSRDDIRREVLEKGFNADLNTFTQSYGSTAVDASLLLMAPVGFLDANDTRVLGTVAAVERELLVDGFVMRYKPETATGVDGLPPGEGAFLACTFWLADNYGMQGRHADARKVLDRLLDLRNDVGLLAEEYDVTARRQVGNFPQAFSHLELVNTAVSYADRQSLRATTAESKPVAGA